MTTCGTLMLVEDDPDVAEAMLDVLTDEGYAVDHASNGREALEMLRAHEGEPLLILLDLMMPDMDGAQFRQAQLSDPRLANIPVVVLSADRRGAETARELGATEFASKPIRPEQLVSIIQRRTHSHA
jgi:two-component system, chemotaxis family, chemotaxis protein CheY